MLTNGISKGKVYCEVDGKNVRVTHVGKRCLIYIEQSSMEEYTCTVEHARLNWTEAPKLKKRYWRWDIDGSHGLRKPSAYLDDNGKTTTGRTYVQKRDLVYKYEEEYVEIEEENEE